MNINLLFKTFAIENLTILQRPGSKKRFEIADIGSVSDLLFAFINYELEEPTLRGVKETFETNFEKIFYYKELGSSIERLATNYESFLKKIAILKFNNSSCWIGDMNYKGINECTLWELLESKASARKGFDDIPAFRDFPTPIVSKTQPSFGILDYIRSDLRNNVHDAKLYTRTELAQLTNLVLGAYLIGIIDNLAFFKKKFFPEFSYLENITNNQEFKKLNDYYIDLLGKEELFDFDNVAIEQLDGHKLLKSLSFTEMDDDVNSDELTATDKQISRIDSVVNIAKDTQRFIIIGEPGSGKSTSLQKILFENASGILNSVQGSRLPIYIQASSFSNSNSFISMIKNEVNFYDFELLHQKYKVLILLDGLNEIEDEFKRTAIKEVKVLLENYPNLDFILTSRKFGFQNNFKLDVFELKKLNDNQIKQLLINVLDLNSGTLLWHQINANLQILDLASNPLMLRMIIQVASLTNNNIPQNKGMLYQLFNNAILEREKKVYTTDTETKKDILSYLAFWMRTNGIFKKVKKAKAKDIIKEKLLVLDRSIGVNEIMKELSDNNFFIEKNDDLEFYHETQQEYFVALEIKNLTYRQKSFNFDYSEAKWFEPILICSDLFSNDEDRFRLFEMIYIGEKFTTPKLIQNFDKSDININFYIGCKVAYNLQTTQPLLFLTAERYLSNCIKIWNWKASYGVEIFDFIHIIKGIAALSSEKIFYDFFYSLKNLQNWFYNKEFDDRSPNSQNIISFEEKMILYQTAFKENLSDYTRLYTVLNSNKNFFDAIHPISRSVFNNYKIFERFLIENLSTTQLIHAYKNLASVELLFRIGFNDLEFFIENYFKSESASEIIFFEYICKNHLRNITGVMFLIECLKDSKKDPNIRLLIIEKLGETQYKTLLFSTLQELFSTKDNLMYFDGLKKVLNKYPTSHTSLNALDIIFTNPEIEKTKISMKCTGKISNNYTLEYENNIIDYREVVKNINNISLDDKFIELTHTPSAKKYGNLIFAKASNETIDYCYENYSGENSFSIHFLNHRNIPINERYYFKKLYRIQTGKQRFLLLETDERTFVNIRKKFNGFNKVKILIGQDFSFTIKEIQLYVTSVNFKLLSELSINIGQIQEFQMFKITIDFSKPFNYHRDVIKSNQSFTRYLQTQICKPEVINFIKEIGLAHLFIQELGDLNFGSILGLNSLGEFFYLYEFKSKRVFTTNIKSKPDEELKIGDTVLIEQNLNISKVDVHFMKSSDFFQGEIITYNEDNGEGFISCSNEKYDYFFMEEYCNFLPHHGLIVKFIPGINSAKNNSSRPMAYAINLIGTYNRMAKVVKIRPVNRSNYIQLEDIESNEILYAIVYKDTRIFNFDGKIEVGELYSYYRRDATNSYAINRINLIAKESNPINKFIKLKENI